MLSHCGLVCTHLGPSYFPAILILPSLCDVPLCFSHSFVLASTLSDSKIAIPDFLKTKQKNTFAWHIAFCPSTVSLCQWTWSEFLLSNIELSRIFLPNSANPCLFHLPPHTHTHLFCSIQTTLSPHPSQAHLASPRLTHALGFTNRRQDPPPAKRLRLAFCDARFSAVVCDPTLTISEVCPQVVPWNYSPPPSLWQSNRITTTTKSPVFSQNN